MSNNQQNTNTSSFLIGANNAFSQANSKPGGTTGGTGIFANSSGSSVNSTFSFGQNNQNKGEFKFPNFQANSSGDAQKPPTNLFVGQNNTNPISNPAPTDNKIAFNSNPFMKTTTISNEPNKDLNTTAHFGGNDTQKAQEQSNQSSQSNEGTTFGKTFSFGPNAGNQQGGGLFGGVKNATSSIGGSSANSSMFNNINSNNNQNTNKDSTSEGKPISTGIGAIGGSLFGGQNKDSTSEGKPISTGIGAIGGSLFGGQNKDSTSEGKPISSGIGAIGGSLFSGQNKDSASEGKPISSGIGAIGGSLFGAQNKDATSENKTSTTGIGGSLLGAQSKETTENKSVLSGTFGGIKTGGTTNVGLFSSQNKETTDNKPVSTGSLGGLTGGGLFGATNKESTENKSVFSGGIGGGLDFGQKKDEAKPVSTTGQFSFGTQIKDQEKQQTTTETKPTISFGANTTGASALNTNATSNPLFGGPKDNKSPINTTTTESKPSLFSKPEGASTTDTNKFTFGSKPSSENNLLSSNTGNQPSSLNLTTVQGETKSTETSNPSTGGINISFGAKATDNKIGGIAFGSKTGTSEATEKPKPTELFTQTKPEDKKSDDTSKISLTTNKEGNLILNLYLGGKLLETKPEIKKDVDEAALNATMKKSIEDVINNWKNDLDNQVERFQSSAESLKHFELIFLKNFETICSLNELINNLKEDGNKTIRNLEDLSTEEDQVIEQLDIMEKQLDEYLNSYQGIYNVDGKNINTTALEISRVVDEVQKDIDEVNSKLSEPAQIGKEDNLCVINYEHPHLKENISLNKNEFTSIINSYYSSLRSIQFMEQNLESKIKQVENEIKERRKEKEREFTTKYY